MRQWPRVLPTVVLLVMSFMLAAHPLVRALAQAHTATAPLAEAQIVICTSHGAMLVDDPAEVPPPSKESPSCPWCALGGGSAGKLPALATVQIGLLDLPLRLKSRMVAVPSSTAFWPADWPAHAPRAPPEPRIA
jgi:hypothetical protein